MLRKIAIVLVIGSLLTFLACGGRDLYRNSLCDANGGATIFVTAQAWREQHANEISSIARVSSEKAYRVVGPHESSTDLNTRFAEEVRFTSAGPGITQHDFRLVDKKTNLVLAKWIRYYTGSWGRTLFESPISMSASCFASAREYEELREMLRSMAAP